MDELVIEEKKYLSSKKAAKRTGYAKDYVGQLCREGKVEARLVGRNWYVLETSIMDHRFGAIAEAKDEGDTPATIPTPEPVSTIENGLEYKWNSPVYTTESYSSLPTEVVPPTQSPAAEKMEQSPQVLNDMQSAWQEWFDKQKEAEKMLPDASEMMLPEADEPVYVRKQDTYSDLERESPVIVDSWDSKEEFVSQEVAVPIRHVPEKPEIRTQTYESEESVPISRKREDVQHQVTYKSPTYTRMPARAPKSPTQEPTGGKGSFLLKVVILSVAAFFAAITYLAFSSKDAAEGGEANTIVNYLTGVSTVESHK